jgi:hypothetical protein
MKEQNKKIVGMLIAAFSIGLGVGALLLYSLQAIA